MIERPLISEYNPFYETYIGLVPDGDLIAILENQLKETTKLYAEAPQEKLNYRYAPGKWSMKEVLGHIVDNERIMSYRLLCIAYGEQKNLPGYEQEDYMANHPFDHCTIDQLLEEFELVRRSSIALLKRLPAHLLANQGKANGGPMTAQALAFILAGHELHHVNILKHKYL